MHFCLKWISVNKDYKKLQKTKNVYNVWKSVTNEYCTFEFRILNRNVRFLILLQRIEDTFIIEIELILGHKLPTPNKKFHHFYLKFFIVFLCVQRDIITNLRFNQLKRTSFFVILQKTDGPRLGNMLTWTSNWTSSDSHKTFIPLQSYRSATYCSIVTTINANLPNPYNVWC